VTLPNLLPVPCLLPFFLAPPSSSYTIYDQHGNLVALLAEDEGSLGRAVGRQLLRTRRPFTATVLDPQGQVIFRLRRPFYLINSSIFIEVGVRGPGGGGGGAAKGCAGEGRAGGTLGEGSVVLVVVCEHARARVGGWAVGGQGAKAPGCWVVCSLHNLSGGGRRVWVLLCWRQVRTPPAAA
jgi:hypothetical protein